MVQLNLALREINCKIVYFGCGLSGKTTNLEVVHQKAAPDSRGELTSIATESDRTLFFDFMPLDLGTVSGMRVKFQLYTVPGQVYYNSTRKLVLRGADGVIFVADSQASKMDENLESLKNLEECLKEQGRELDEMPHVVQYNKRDLEDLASLEDLRANLNQHGAPEFEAVAATGDGVLETFKALAGMMLERVKSMSTESASKPTVQAQRMASATSRPSPAAPKPVTDAQRLQGGIAARTPATPQPVSKVESRLIERREPLASPVVDPVAEAAPAKEKTERRPAAATAMITPERPQPSVRQAADAPARPRGSTTTTSGMMMVSTARRRRKSRAGVWVILLVVLSMLVAAGAAAWHHFLS